MYILSPYGYALFTTDGNFVEACYLENTKIPVSENSSESYYYVGLCCYATKNYNGEFIYVENGEIVSEKQLQRILSKESQQSVSQIYSGDFDGDSLLNSASTTSTETTKKVNEDYFKNLVDIGNYQEDSCSAISTGILFAYYDYYVHSGYVPSGYSKQTAGKSVGFTPAFTELLCDYIYGEGVTPYAVTYQFAKEGLNQYIKQETPLPFEITTTSIEKNMRYLISNNIVFVGSVKGESEDDTGHAVVVYGYSENSNGVTYYAHYAYPGASNNMVTIPQDDLVLAGYIYDCFRSGNHDYTISYTFQNYHSGDYHYDQRKLDCKFCPYITYDYVSRYCDGNCMMIMGDNHESLY